MDGRSTPTNSLVRGSSRLCNRKIGVIKSVILNLYSLERQAERVTNFDFTILCRINRIGFSVAVKDSVSDVSDCAGSESFNRTTEHLICLRHKVGEVEICVGDSGDSILGILEIAFKGFWR